VVTGNKQGWIQLEKAAHCHSSWNGDGDGYGYGMAWHGDGASSGVARQQHDATGGSNSNSQAPRMLCTKTTAKRQQLSLKR